MNPARSDAVAAAASPTMTLTTLHHQAPTGIPVDLLPWEIYNNANTRGTYDPSMDQGQGSGAPLCPSDLIPDGIGNAEAGPAHGLRQ